MIKMKLPNLMEAKKRTNEKVKTKTNEYILNHKLKHLGEGLFYYVKTYGCQMNEHDSENIKAILEDMGYKEANSMETADLVILNTCAIRDTAEKKILAKIGGLKIWKKADPKRILAVGGCMTAQKEIPTNLIKTFPFIDIIFGTENLSNFGLLLDEFVKTRKKQRTMWR